MKIHFSRSRSEATLCRRIANTNAARPLAWSRLWREVDCRECLNLRASKAGNGKAKDKAAGAIKPGRKIRLYWRGKVYKCKVLHVWKNANDLVGEGFGISAKIVGPGGR